MTATALAIEPLRDARRGFTRSRLCAAARDLFARQGYAGTTMEQVAQAAGTQRSTLYNHFRDKAEILAAIAEDYLAGLAALVAELPGPWPDRAAIDAWLGQVVAFAQAERMPTVLFMSLGSGLEVPAALRGLGGRLMALLAARLPAFACALRPGEGLTRARALALQQQLGWLCLHHAQASDPALAADMVTVTAEQLETFLRQTRPRTEDRSS